MLRTSLEGPYVSCWHELNDNEQETKATLFGMTIASTMNMGSGVLKVMADEEWTPALMDNHVRHMLPPALKQFIQECKI